MIRLLCIFLVLLVAVLFGIQLTRDPGYLLIAINHWTVETTLLIALAVLFVAFLVFHTLLRFMAWLTQRPYAFNQWRTKRKVRKAQTRTQQGLIEFSEGYWSQAQTHLLSALPFTDTPLLNYLTAARAAQEMGDSTLRDNFLREAQQSMPETQIAVELTQAQLQLANQQWEQALATLRHLHDLAPHHPYVLKLLYQLYREVNDWQQLINLLPALKKYRVITPAGYETIQQEAYLQLLLALIKQNQKQAVDDLYHALPKRLKDNPDLVHAYAQFLMQCNEDGNAEMLLRSQLRKNYNESLINLYGHINKQHAQLAFIESLLKNEPHSAALHLCLGRLFQHCDLWGNAKVYLEESIALEASPAAYWELGRLLERLNDQPNACIAYKKGLEFII